MTVERRINLRCHPSARPEPVRSIRVVVRRSRGAELLLAFRLDGNLSRIQLPPARRPKFAQQLWQHTCFEAFIAVDGQPAYHEYNFSPTGEWAVFAFRGYRDGGPCADETMRPRIAVHTTDHGLQLDARVRLDTLSDIHPRAVLRLGLSAVIETVDGLSYWALRHAADKPDFHAVEGFTLLLEPAHAGPEVS